MVRCWVNTRSGTGWKKPQPIHHSMDRTANWCTGGCWFTLAVLAYPSFPIFDERNQSKCHRQLVCCCCTTWHAYGLSFTINQTRVEYCAKTIDSLVVLECFSVAIEKGKTTHPSTESPVPVPVPEPGPCLVSSSTTGFWFKPSSNSSFQISNPIPIPVSRFQTQFQFQFPDFKPSSNSSFQISNPVPVWFLDFLTASRTSNSNQPNQVTYLLQWFQLPSGGYVAQKSSKIFFFFF